MNQVYAVPGLTDQAEDFVLVTITRYIQSKKIATKVRKDSVANFELTKTKMLPC